MVLTKFLGEEGFEDGPGSGLHAWVCRLPFITSNSHVGKSEEMGIAGADHGCRRDGFKGVLEVGLAILLALAVFGKC